MRNRPLAARTAVAVLAAAAVAGAVLLPGASAPVDLAADPGRTIALSLPEQAADTVDQPATDEPAPDRAAPDRAGTAPAVPADAVGPTSGGAPDPATPPATPGGPSTAGPTVADPTAADPTVAVSVARTPDATGPAPAPVDAPATAARTGSDPADEAVAAAPAAAARPAAAGPTDTAPTTSPAPGVVTGMLTRVWGERLVAEGDGAEIHVVGTGEHETSAAAAQLQAWVEIGSTAYRVDPTAVVGVEDGATVTVELGASPGPALPHPLTELIEVEPAVQAAGDVTFGEGSTDLFGAAATTVTHDVTVVLAIPKGAVKDSMTASAVASTVSGGVNTFWSQQSRNQRGVRVVASHSWQTLSRDCSDAFALWNEVAARVGWTGGTRRHLLVYLPPSAGCGAGLGTVASGPDVGGRLWVSYNTTSIIAHELGHNLGLGHSDGLLCTGRADGSYSSGAWQSGCAVHGYRDFYDIMGVSWAHVGSLAAPHADALGLLRSTEKLVTSQPVRVRLVPATSDGLRVLRIDDPGGAYYVEYRVATGWDAWLSNNYKGLNAGVIVHRRAPYDARKTLLLDGSVTSGTRTDDWKSALPAGASLTTASGVTRIVVEQQSSTGATLVVYRNGVGPAAVQPPSGGAQVEIRTPLGLDAAAGTTVFSGVATAPEGTLMWEVVQNGVRKASGTAATGSNGTFDTFQVPVALPAGSFTFRVWVPDESDGEGTVDPALLQDQTTLTLS